MDLGATVRTVKMDAHPTIYIGSNEVLTSNIHIAIQSRGYN